MFFRKGYLVFILIIIFLLIFYFTLFFTTKNYLLPKLLKGIGIKEIKEVSLSPLFNQIILAEGKGEILNFKRAEIKFTPLAIFKRKIIIKKFVLEKLELKINEKEIGIKNERETKKEIAFILPFFLKEIEIKEMVLKEGNFKQEKVELRNLKINLVATLKDGKINSKIKEVSGGIYYDKYNYNFSLLNTDLQFDGSILLLNNLNFETENSSFLGEILYNLKENKWQIKIDSALLNLKDFTNYEGEGKIKGNLVIKDNRYDGKIDIFFKKIKIVKEFENIKGNLNFSNHLVNYQLQGKIFGSSFESKGKFDLKNFSYSFIAEIFNLENFLPFKIKKGEIEISGEKFNLVNFKFAFTFLDDKINFLKGSGQYQNKKIFIKKLISKGKEYSLTLQGELSKEKIVVTTEITKFPLSLLNTLFPKEIKGIVSGKGEVVYEPKTFLIKGDWQIADFSFKELNLSFKDFEFSGEFFLKERIDFNGEINLKELKTPYLFFDTLKINSFLKDFQLIAVFNNSFLKIGGNFLSDLKDSLLLSLKGIELVFNGNSFISKTPVIIEIKENSFKLENFNLRYKEGEIVFNLEKERDILKLESEIKTFALEDFFSLFKKEKYLFGKVNSQLFLTYDLKNKYLNSFLFATKIFDFHFQELSFDSILGKFSLVGETIILKNLSLFKEGKDSRVSGFLIFDFTKKELVSQDLTLELEDFPSEIIFFIPEILILKEGKITGKINLTGSLRNPRMRGRVNLTGGEIILKIPESKISDVSATIIFSEKEIIFAKILGKVKNGEILSNGFIRFGEFFQIDTLHKDIKFTNLPITYQKDFIGVVNGDVLLSLNKKNYLKIIGDAEIKEALITIPFGEKGGEKGKEVDSLLELDLTFRGERNIWLRNRNADVELGVDFNLKLKEGKFIYSGKIITKQGYLYYLGRSLQLKEGEIVFENISQFDPKISLIGFLLTKPISYQNKKERFKIFLEISGYLRNPNFNLFSEPPYLSQEEIISYLGLSFTPEELKNWEERDIFLDILQDRILSYFERETSERLRKYIGLDYFRLESSFRGEPYLRLSVGKYLGERLYFSYTHSFIEEKQDVFRAEYYLNKNHRIIGERNDLGKTVIKYLFYFRF